MHPRQKEELKNMKENSSLQLPKPVVDLTRPAWRTSNSICALATEERHLGHIVKIAGRWHAFDATHFNEELTGFRPLGTFESVYAAKEAVAEATNTSPLQRSAAA